MQEQGSILRISTVIYLCCWGSGLWCRVGRACTQLQFWKKGQALIIRNQMFLCSRMLWLAFILIHFSASLDMLLLSLLVYLEYHVFLMPFYTVSEQPFISFIIYCSFFGCTREIVIWKREQVKLILIHMFTSKADTCSLQWLFWLPAWIFPVFSLEFSDHNTPGDHRI